MTLGTRLRELRDSALGRPVRQTEMAKALGLKNSTISTWETDARPPNNERLRAMATYFATPRSLERSRALKESELDDAERAARDELLDELIVLRDGAPDEARDNPWHFPDGAPVRIICGELDDADRPKFASDREHNYMTLSAYADLDSLVELFGHVRAQNPKSDVQFELASRLESDDTQSHLVVLGNMGWLGHGALARKTPPVAPVPVDGLDGEVFETPDGSQYGPTLSDPADQDSPVAEDVALFWRTTSPFNPARTLTFCSGVFTRGVYAAVRLFTDKAVRDANVRYVRTAFPGATEYGFLVRVPVLGHATGTPLLVPDSAIRLPDVPSQPRPA